MNIWRQAEEILNAIQGDLHEDPLGWESAARRTDKVKALVPAFPHFRPQPLGETLQPSDLRNAEVRIEVEHLEQGLLKRDRELALRSAASALRLVQALGRKGA